MQFTKQDRQTLYDTWMSYKAKLRITQIEMARRLGISQLEFSKLMHGEKPLESAFVSRFCEELGVDPYAALPSLREAYEQGSPSRVTLNTTLTVDGEITSVKYTGNQVIIEYQKSLIPSD